MAASVRELPRIAFGPRLPDWGSWNWIGQDLCDHLASRYRTLTFAGMELPDCELAVVVKHPESLQSLTPGGRQPVVIYCPVDWFSSSAEIDALGPHLTRCDRIVIHAEPLRKYFAAYAPVEYIDHHWKFTIEPPAPFRGEGDLLWVGARSNLPALVEGVNRLELPARLRVLSNWEDSSAIPSAGELGFTASAGIVLENWSPDAHRRALRSCRAALDIKGNDFRARHKPPAKAIDYLVSGLPLALNPDSAPAEHLRRLGFETAAPFDPQRWLAPSYWEETRRFGAALSELLSLERIGFRWRCLIDELLALRGR